MGTPHPIGKNELREIVEYHLLKYANDFAERLAGNPVREDVYQEVEAIMTALDSYAIEAGKRAELKGRIAENQVYLDRINGWKPKPGELSLGSAGASIELSGWKSTFEDRLAQLQRIEKEGSDVR